MNRERMTGKPEVIFGSAICAITSGLPTIHPECSGANDIFYV